MKTTTFILSAFAAVMLSQQPATAQPIGGPALTNSHGEFTLSFSGGYVRKEIYGVENRSTRFLAKGILGIAKSLDIFVEAGAANLALEMSGATPVKLEDTYRFAIGAGFTLRYFHFQPAKLSFFLNAQVFRTTCSPATTMVNNLAGIPVTQLLMLKYDWREALINSGFVKEIGAVNLIGGIRGSVTQRLETKITASAVGADPGAEIRETGEYRSGLQANPFFGIEFKLPARYLFSCEASGRSGSDYALYIGISQTGKPEQD